MGKSSVKCCSEHDTALACRNSASEVTYTGLSQLKIPAWGSSGSQAPSLTEKLLAVDDCQGKESHFRERLLMSPWVTTTSLHILHIPALIILMGYVKKKGMKVVGGRHVGGGSGTWREAIRGEYD